MDKKELIIIGVIIIVIAIVAIFTYAPSNEEVHASELIILNNNTLGNGSTLYVKLTSKDNVSLSDKTIHITVKDKNKTTVADTSAKTHMTGVAVVKLNSLSDGDYEIIASFEGDENYTACNVSKKITVGDGYVEEDLSNYTEILNETDLTNQETTTQDSDNSHSSDQSSSSSKSKSSSSSTSSSSKSKSSSDTGYYDENGKPILPSYDENGKEIIE